MLITKRRFDMEWVRKTLMSNKRSIELFKRLKKVDYIHYEELTLDMRFIFRQYFDFKRRDIGDNKILISNKSKDGVNYAKGRGHILYDLDNIAFKNILLEMKQENRKYKKILNKKEGDEF